MLGKPLNQTDAAQAFAIVRAHIGPPTHINKRKGHRTLKWVAPTAHAVSAQLALRRAGYRFEHVPMRVTSHVAFLLRVPIDFLVRNQPPAAAPRKGLTNPQVWELLKREAKRLKVDPYKLLLAYVREAKSKKK